MCFLSEKLLISPANNIIEEIQIAAAGMGSPLKNEPSEEVFSTLNLASRNAPQITYMHAASHPRRPKGSSAHR